MNKYQEALNNIKTEPKEKDYYGDEIPFFKEDDEDIALLQELVDKSTPKKVTQFEHEGNMYCWCHECDHVEMIREIDFMNYCPNCGQKLEWPSDD